MTAIETCSQQGLGTGSSDLYINVLCFPQGGQAGPLQKEELQSGVDAANSAAQQYQRSKSSQLGVR